MKHFGRVALAFAVLAPACAPPSRLPTPRVPTYVLIVNATPDPLGVLVLAHGRGWPLALIAARDSALAPLPTELLLEGDSIQLALTTRWQIRPGLLREKIAIDRGRLNRIPLSPGPSYPRTSPRRENGGPT